MTRSTQGWCHRHTSDRIGVWYAHLGEKRWVELHGLRDPIVHVTVREALPEEPGEYWAWWENAASSFRWLWPSSGQVETCFAYGSAPEEKRGRGHLLRVVVTETGPPP